MGVKRQFMSPQPLFSIKTGLYQLVLFSLLIKAATILRLLGNETIHFNTRGKKSEPDLRKQLNIEVKSTTKFKFFSLNILIYLYILLL